MYCPFCGAQAVKGAAFCAACGKGLADVAGVSATPSSATPSEVYAGFWRRFVAAIVDTAIFGTLVWAALVVESGTNLRFEVFVVLVASLGVGYLLYIILAERSALQGTLGKRLLGIKVVNTKGERIGLGAAIARLVSRSLSFLTLGVGFLMTAFTRRRQALHDMITGTLVVSRTATAQDIVNAVPGATMGMTVGIRAVRVAALAVITLAFVGGLITYDEVFNTRPIRPVANTDAKLEQFRRVCAAEVAMVLRLLPAGATAPQSTDTYFYRGRQQMTSAEERFTAAASILRGGGEWAKADFGLIACVASVDSGQAQGWNDLTLETEWRKAQDAHKPRRGQTLAQAWGHERIEPKADPKEEALPEPRVAASINSDTSEAAGEATGSRPREKQ